MRILIVAACLGFMALAAHADQALPLFGSEAAGVVQVSQEQLSPTSQQVSLTEQNGCLDQTCPNSPTAAIHQPAPKTQP